MTLEFLVSQTPHQQQEGTMYRHPNPATQTYSASYNGYSQTPTTQYPSEYPPGTASYQPSTAVDVQQQQPPPTTNPWGSAGFPTAGVPSVDWGSSQDPFAANAFTGQTPAGPTSGSPYNTDDIDYYQGFGPSTAAVSSVSQALHRSAMRSPYHDWMRSTSYRVNPQTGKTRTKDKYRVVYSDHQRLELEKEFHCSRYITIRRKAELAVSLGLSERQVKIWFQNRRAKERKQTKKGSAMSGGTADRTRTDVSSSGEKGEAGGELDIKKEKTIDDELEPIRSSPSSTPEVLEIACTQHHYSTTPGRLRTEPELALNAPPQLQRLGTGACSLQPAHHAAMSASLLHSMPQMPMK